MKRAARAPHRPIPATVGYQDAGKAMFQMMGVFAEFQRAILQERVRAGLARARSEGKLAIPGRPAVRVIAKRFGIDPGTVQRISRPFDGGASAVVV